MKTHFLTLTVVLLFATRAFAYEYVGNNPVNAIDPLGLQADIILFPMNDPMHNQAMRIPSDPSTLTVAGHGSPFGVDEDPKKLAERIKGLPDYSPDKPVWLLTCEAGGDTQNKNVPNIAQTLSTLLPNVIMGAEDNVIYSTPADWVFWSKNTRIFLPWGSNWGAFQGGRRSWREH